jgi:ATP-dependent Clp protease ATP-binding subunit ClpA
MSRRGRRGRHRTVPLLTAEARTIQMGAFEHARRLGHPYVGCEHTLLALAGAGHPAAAELREHGVTPDRVEEQVIRLWGGGLFGDLDRNALAAVGIDVDAVRDRMAESFGQQALTRASHAAHRDPAVPWWDPRRRGPGIHADGVFLPHSPDAIQALRTAIAEKQARHDEQVGVEHLALGLLSVTDGLVPPILSALGVSAGQLRAAVADSRRETGEPPHA